MEAVQRKIDQVEQELKEAKDSGAPFNDPGVVALNNRLAALTNRLTELERQGKPFISDRD